MSTLKDFNRAESPDYDQRRDTYRESIQHAIAGHFTSWGVKQPFSRDARSNQRITVDSVINNPPTIIIVQPPTTQNRMQDIQLTGSPLVPSMWGDSPQWAKILTLVLLSRSFGFCIS
jgi:hypothetical protein